MSTYQTFNTIDGSMYGIPRYQGIEYDRELPTGMVVGTPGGVSTTHHHHTKGMYGRGNTSSDIYAGQGERYNNGEFGSIYQVGHSGGQGQGYYSGAPDKQYYLNAEEKKSSVIEGFEDDAQGFFDFSDDTPNEDAFELIEQADSDLPQIVETYSEPRGQKYPMWTCMILIFMVVVMASFWSHAIRRYVEQYHNNGIRLSWKELMLVSFGLSILCVGVMWYMKEVYSDEDDDENILLL